MIKISFLNCFSEKYENISQNFGMVWRFAPMADPLVSEWHCRDLDSRISPRELSAVEDWQISGRTYHIMRDHPYHVATIVGCCFGMKITSDNYLTMTDNFDKMLDFVGKNYYVLYLTVTHTASKMAELFYFYFDIRLETKVLLVP